jgi:hypothetical protein
MHSLNTFMLHRFHTYSHAGAAIYESSVHLVLPPMGHPTWYNDWNGRYLNVVVPD